LATGFLAATVFGAAGVLTAAGALAAGFFTAGFLAAGLVVVFLGATALVSFVAIFNPLS
jgi:hypothetical protein